MNDHIPVLFDEVLDGLNALPGAHLIDGTLGAGGHTTGWLEATAPKGRVLGFDRDAAAIERAMDTLAPYHGRVAVVHASYVWMSELAPQYGFNSVDAILLDLGFSSMQIDNPERGFAFSTDGPLDMRYDNTDGWTAADLVNTLSKEELANIIFQYGEERHSRRIASAIIEARPVYTTRQLADLIAGVVYTREKIHPATRTFQALRIATNDELGQLEKTLPQTINLLKPGGRLGVISFHSLEDRIVKQFIRREGQECICPPTQPVCTCNHMVTLQAINRKPITASETEIQANPRARSAKLRIAERV